MVDHEQRRRELGQAVWRLVARGGVEAVSVRGVAAEAGWSTGSLRHYFQTKEQLLSFAAALVTEHVSDRIRSRRRTGHPRQVVREILTEVMPLDGQRRTEAAISFAFLNLARVDSRIAAEQQEHFEVLSTVIHDLVRQLAATGHLHAHLDRGRAAVRLHALIDGLSLHLLFGRISTTEAQTALDTELAALITDHPCSETPGPRPHSAGTG